MIFIIDDDAAVRDSLRALLEVAGYAVEDFPSAEAFLASAALAERDCLILSDIHMESISGVELLEKVRGGGNAIAVILITARPSAEITARAQAADALAVLEKPIKAAVLLKLIEEATRP